MEQIVTKKVELELVGLDSNAFSIMGAFKQAARRQGTPADEVKKVLAEAMSGDYDHLLATIMMNTESPDEDEDEDEEYGEEYDEEKNEEPAISEGYDE